MKKIWVVLLTVSLFIFLSLTCQAAMVKKTITPGDISSFKGTWKGDRVVKGQPRMFPVEMEITNDKLPLQGKLTIQNVLRTGGSKGRTDIVNIMKNELNKEGNLILKSPDFQAELSFYVEGTTMKLEGPYQFKEVTGTIILNKK
jgi:hypothetical protein